MKRSRLGSPLRVLDAIVLKHVVGGTQTKAATGHARYGSGPDFDDIGDKSSSYFVK
jgi:hypothetical protein